MAKKTKKIRRKSIKKPKKLARGRSVRGRRVNIGKKSKKRVIKKKKAIKKIKPKRITRKKVKKTIRKTRRKAAKRLIRRARRHVKLTAGKKKKLKAKRRRPRKAKSVKPRTYIGKGALEQLFESQAKVKLLKFFLRNSQELFQPKEIFKRLRTNIGILRHEMSKLENIDLIRQKKAWLTFERKRGGVRKEKKTVYYLNPAFDFVQELKNLVLKSTIASKEDLVNSVRKLGNIKLFLLAGLFTGDDVAKADILIVGDKINSRKLNTFFKDLEAEVGKELNCATMSTREFNYRYDMYDRFVRDLINGKSEVLINRINLW